MKQTVSVIIPTFNRSRLLRRAIDSAIEQTHSDIEVIVVDDGSTDDTAEMLRSCFGWMSKVKTIHQENRGVCVARNRGLDAAQGEFIAFLDSDDVWHPWKLEVQVACLHHRPEAGMVWTDMDAVGPDGQLVQRRYLRRMYSPYQWFPDDALFGSVEHLQDIMSACPEHLAGVPVRWGQIHRAMILGNLVHTSTAVLTRERLEKVGRFDEGLAPAGEDHDFHLRTCEIGPVGLIDTPSILYQTGRADRLTRHRSITARNYLLTLERAVARAPADVKPSKRMLRKARAGGHAWLANALLEENSRTAARGHLARALCYAPLRPRLAAELIMTLLPQPIDAGMRSLYHRIKHRSAPVVAPAEGA